MRQALSSSTQPANGGHGISMTAASRRDLDTSFMAGGGDLGQLMRDHDWAATPLGPPGGWPRSLKTVVRIMLTSRQPIWMRV